MDKNTLSNYGWIVVMILCLSVLIALATPFGTYVKDGIKSTTTGLFDVESNALEVVGVDLADQNFTEPASCGVSGHCADDGLEHGIIATCSNGHTYTCECTGWVIPEGGTYYVKLTSTSLGDYKGAVATYNSGEQLPCGYTIGDKDVFVYGDYEYRCNKYYNGSEWVSDPQYRSDPLLRGWGVRVLDSTKTSYGEIIDNINGASVTNINYTFYKCEFLTVAPTIHSNITKMSSTFKGCTALTTPPDMSNASSVLDMQDAFYSCKSLTTAPKIPDTVRFLNRTFMRCTSLTDASGIIIPNKVTSLQETFRSCVSLTTPPEIPNGVTNIQSTFNSCESLATAPKIPDSVTNASDAFYYCHKLTGEISIPCSLVSKNYTYKNCPATIIYYHIDGCDSSCGA